MRCQMEKSGKIAVWTIIVMLSVYGGAMAWQLPDTGQTTCYNGSQPITCPVEGAAFYGQDAHYNINPLSYEKIGDNIVKDNNTGLIWEVKTAANKDTKYTWDEAVKYADDMTLGGYSDWRLPTFKELSLLVNRGMVNPSVDPNFFPNTVSDNYWSATEYSTGSLWAVKFSNGRGDIFYNKTDTLYVRAVRGEKLAEPVLIDNGDGTVTDMTTKLMWQEKGESKNWETSLKYCEELELAKYKDWRMPNIAELQSLFNYSLNANVLYESNQSNPQALWSSSSRAEVANYNHAWYLAFVGYISPADKGSERYVHAVRGPVTSLFSLNHAILTLKVLAGIELKEGESVPKFDFNNNKKLDLAELVYILAYLAKP